MGVPGSPASVTGAVLVPRARGELHGAPRVALAGLWSPARQAVLKTGTELGLLSSLLPPSQELPHRWARDSGTLFRPFSSFLDIFQLLAAPPATVLPLGGGLCWC